MSDLPDKSIPVTHGVLMSASLRVAVSGLATIYGLLICVNS
jgi:hypothetical protein